jgi:putative peptide zinc metalloprotease protein
MSSLPLLNPVAAPTAHAIPWRMRVDLIVRRQDSGAWVVKDPLTLNYVRLSDQEMSVLRSLDGRRTARQMLQALQDIWPASAFSVDDVSDFLGQLINSQLVVPTQPVPRTAKSDGGGRPNPRRWMSLISGLLQLRIRLLDPTPLLNAIQPWMSPGYLHAAAVATVALCVTALWLVTLRFELFVTNLPGPIDFFGPDNLLLVMAVFVIVKMFHEAGHAVAARCLGAECHEIGIMLVLLTPILFTNVTDAWMLNRRSRLLITAAGILVEIVLASMATILWFFASPGLLKALLANVMVICTFGTIFFNGNPLLRYDGYFLLVDAIGRPNLAQRSSHRVRQLLEDVLLGSRSEPLLAGDRFLLFYGIVSGIYRTLLAVAILSMLSHLFDVWNLGVLGVTVMVVAALPLVVSPLWAFATGLLAELSFRNHRRIRLLRTLLILALLLAVSLIPLPHSIVAPAVVEPLGTPLFASLAGSLNSSARYGDLVDRGTTLAVLTAPLLQRQRIKYQGAVKMHEAQVRAMELRRQDVAAASLPEARALLESSRTRLEEFDRELGRLTVVAPISGTLMPPRARTNVIREEALSEWSGCPLDERNRDALIEQGTLLGHVCESSDRELLLQLDSQDAALLQRSQVADFQSTGNSGTTWRGIVKGIAPLSEEDLPAELIVAGLTRPPSIRTADPEVQHWQAIVQLTIPHDSSAPILYSTGAVRIYVEPVSVASRIWRYLRSTFR